MIKDRNYRDLTEAEELRNTSENCSKKRLNDPHNHDSVVTHLKQTSWSVKSKDP